MSPISKALAAALKHYQAGRLQQAEQCYRKVLRQKPACTDAHHGLGTVLLVQGKLAEAQVHYQQAIALNPQDAVAYYNLGNALLAQQQLAEAQSQYQQALAIAPNFPEVHNNLGNLFLAQGGTEDAIACYQQALACNPNYAEAYYNLGNALKEQGRFADAIAYLRQALTLEPNYAEAHQTLGMLLLLTGDFKSGFTEYEWRWQTKEYTQRASLSPQWPSSDLQGKTILLLCEQGFGDAIQFIRYASLIAQQGGHVIVGCYEELLRLFNTVPGIEQLVTKGALIEFDYCAPLVSLPYLLGTTLETIPAPIPYIFPPQPYPFTLAAPPETCLKVGIVWAGNPTHKKDRDRSCKLEHSLSVLNLPKITFYSLQIGSRAADLAQLDLGEKVQDLSEKLGDFADTAAAIDQLDLVITVDTAVAHLAGAMGKPVWVLLSFVADWRWLLEREDSPWYPTARLFRQSQPGDWAGVFEQVAIALQQWVEQLQRNNFTANSSNREGEFIDEQRDNLYPLPDEGFNRLKKCRHGLFLYNIHDICVSKSLDLYGEYREEEIDLLKQLIESNDLIVEIGTNIGAHTIFLAKTVGAQGTVMAFEPQRILFQNLCANLALNSLVNVYCYNVALGAQVGAIQVPGIDASKLHNSGSLSLEYENEGELVQVIPLDSLNLPYCRLIKVDLEGMQLPVLQGAIDTINRLKPMLYVEYDHSESSHSLIQYIDSLGYQIYWHKISFYRSNNYFQNPENVFGHLGSTKMLCVHRSDTFTVKGLEAVKVPKLRPKKPGF